MASTLTIHVQRLGQRRALLNDRTVPMPSEWETVGTRVTLRSLITHVVRHEVAAFEQRQREAQFVQVLTRDEIAAAVERGKVTMGGNETAQTVDAESAVATAVQAFDDGLYHVFVDDRQQEDLDGKVTLRPDSRVLFLRLVALAGG